MRWIATNITYLGYLAPKYVGASPVNCGATVWSDLLSQLRTLRGRASQELKNVLIGRMELLTDWTHLTGSLTVSSTLALGYILARSFQYSDIG